MMVTRNAYRGAATIAVLALAGCNRVPMQVPPSTAAGPFLPAILQGERSEVKLALSPDGRTMVWGVVETGGMLVLKTSRQEASGAWSVPAPVSFASAKDFDPAFSPDGRWLYFFSSRPGGFGDDDLWRAPFDRRTGTFGTPENLGGTVNTSGREWAPGLSADGRWLLFSSDGRGGRKQDLYRAPRRGDGWGTPVAIAPANGDEDDFDGTFLPDGSIVFARGNSDDGPVRLFHVRPDGAIPARKLQSTANCADFVIGPSTSSAVPGTLFISAPCPPGGTTRLDIIAIPLSEALKP